MFCGKVSFRSVPRILKLFSYATPHFTSVINWSLRVGIFLLNQVTFVPEEWIAIMDHSIDIGVKKILVVLRVPLTRLQKKGAALTLQDVECIGIKITEQSSGELVFESLKEIFNKSGNPVAIIKDGGSDLAKGVRLWQEGNPNNPVHVIDDIGHVVANAIKAQYSKAKTYALFLSIINRYSKQLRQTKWAFLIPPKLRTKGRFQGISRLTKWAEKIIHFLEEEKTSSDEMKQIKKTLSGIKRLKKFIREFASSVLITTEFMKIIKNQGLTSRTYEESISILAKLADGKIKSVLMGWLDKHIQIQKQLTSEDIPLMTSSDILESLFGTFKSLLERGSMQDMNKQILLIPMLCRIPNEREMEEAIKKTKHADIKNWETNNIPYTQNQKRRSFFQRKQPDKVPDFGCFHA